MGLTLSQAFEKAHELGDGAFALITLATSKKMLNIKIRRLQ